MTGPSHFANQPKGVPVFWVYALRPDRMLGIDKPIPPVLRHDQSIKVQFDALLKAFA